jgi:hypothetical protein
MGAATKFATKAVSATDKVADFQPEALFDELS